MDSDRDRAMPAVDHQDTVVASEALRRMAVTAGATVPGRRLTARLTDRGHVHPVAR